MKRFLSLLLVVVLLFSLAVPAFAAVPVVSVDGDVGVVAPAMGKLAAVAADSAFPPVYSPESYLIQSFFNCNIELLRPIFKQYKYCQFRYDLETKKIIEASLFNSFVSFSPQQNGMFFLSGSNEFPLRSIGCYSLNKIDDKIFNDATPTSSMYLPFYASRYSFDRLKKTEEFSYLYISSFNYNWFGISPSKELNEKNYLTATSPNSIVTYAQTGVVPVEPPVEPLPDTGLGGDVTLKEFSDILDGYIAKTCAPNGADVYNLDYLNNTNVTFSYRNSYGSGSNTIRFNGGYVYVNGTKYDFNKDAVSKKKVFALGKSGIIDTIFSDYDVISKYILNFETDKEAKVILVKKEHFGSYNFNDLPVTYSITSGKTPDVSPDFGEDKTDGFDGDYGVKILLPRNGFKQSQLNAVKMKIYYKIPFNGDEASQSVKVSGYVGDTKKVVASTTNKLEGNTIFEGYLDVLGAVNWNTVTPITVTVTDYTGKAYTCSVNVICYDDFVDVDEDGKDDRTNQDNWFGSSDLNKPIYPDNSPPEGANVVDWFKWFFGQIGQFFDTLKSGFDSVISYGASFSSFLGSVFSYLPSEIFTIISLGFVLLVALRVLGR